MSALIEIAFATCSPTLEALELVARRFAAVTHVHPYPALVDGSNADDLRSRAGETEAHAVIAFPKPAAALARAGVRVPIVPVEFPADVLLGRVESTLETAGSVAVLPPAGSVSPATGRLLRRLGGAVHLLPYENQAHLRDLVVRCRRMGVEALVGGQSVVPYAEEEGLRAVTIVDGPDEAAGVMGQTIVKAAALAAPRCTRRAEELACLGLILEKIAQGAIGPSDAALCVDRGGRVTAAFRPPARVNGRPLPRAALPVGLPALEALAAASAGEGALEAGDAAPVALDLYPLANRTGDGYLLVLRSSPRPVAVFGADAEPADGRVARLLERVDALLDRTETLTRARAARRAPRRFLASLRRRTFLVDWSRVRFFELRSGLVYASLATGETYATNYTLADVAARVDARDFFRIHRNVIVNLNYVTELERHGVSQFRVLIEGSDAPSFVVSRPASAALRKLLKY